MKLIFLVLSLYYFSTNVYCSTINLKKVITNLIENIRIEAEVPALAVGIISSGKLVYSKGFGAIDEENKNYVSDQTLFRIASISKLFTAQAIMQLVEKNKIELQAPISRYLPVFEGSLITVKQLLSHSSGIKDSVKPVPFQQNRTSEQYFNNINKTLSLSSSINNFDYSDTGFNILGGIITVVTGVSFEKYIEQNILNPLNMKDSGYFNGNNSYKAQVLPYRRGRVIDAGNRRPYDPSFFPSEGLNSNIQDLSHWLIATLNHDKQLLKADSFKNMLVPQVKTPWGDIYVGLGWQVYSENKTKIARHLGSVRGFKSLLKSYPESRRGIIVLSNSSGTPRKKIVDEIEAYLIDSKYWHNGQTSQTSQ
ncbi:MAG: beta-lactamase family protein [Colwellia sp.]|nr:beta-lactamase family protein [Colwellia sp.]